MARFKNVQEITTIKLAQNVQCYCPLGNDWYTNKLEIEICPEDIIPDYCEVDDFIRGLSGEELIIEDVVNKVFEYIKSEYAPRFILVKSYVDDAKHLPVVVEKEG